MTPQQSIPTVQDELARYSAHDLRAALIRRLEREIADRIEEVRQLRKEEQQPPVAALRLVHPARRSHPKSEVVARIQAVLKENGKPMLTCDVGARMPDVSYGTVCQYLARHFRRVQRGVYALPEEQ